MDPEKETTKAGIASLAEIAFEKRERVRMLEMMNTPVEYEDRKKAMVELELARHEANQAEAALRALNPYQTGSWPLTYQQGLGQSKPTDTL